MGCQPPKGWISRPPTAMLTEAVTKVTASEGTSAYILRVKRSRAAVTASEATTSRAPEVKPSGPGRMMTSTPMKPTMIAAQRRQPTGSRRNSAAPSVTISGRDCNMAEALENSMSPSAVR
ncbi:hypothetical protein D3C87_1524010 [compost metagenome]